MTIWHITSLDNLTGDHSAELYDCGSYYFFLSNTTAESTWSIKNEGNEPLLLDLPLVFNDPDFQRIQIIQQPAESTLLPGEETLFKIKYENSGPHGDVFLKFLSNDPEASGCGMLIGGNATTEMCVCRDGQAQTLGDCISSCPPGFASGILLNYGICAEEGVSCAPLEIMDPCNCENLVNIGNGQYLFRDKLSIKAAPDKTYFLTENTSGFRRMDGMPVMLPMGPIGLFTTDQNGEASIMFYRLPGEAVDIRIDGERFQSAACPSMDACLKPIPSMSEWSLIILALLLIITSVTFIIQAKESYKKTSMS